MSISPYETYLLHGEALPAGNALVLPEFESSSDWTGVWAHEYFHFLQLTGTGAGRQIAWLFAQLGHATGAFLREPPEHLKTAQVWWFPIRLWCAEEENEALRKALQKQFSFLIWAWDTLELYLGRLPRPAVGNRWNKQCPWPWSTEPPESAVLPQLNMVGRAEHFGAFHVMETAAAIQGLRMEDADVALNDGRMGFAFTRSQRQTLLRMPPQYSIGLRFIEQHSTVPDSMVASVAVLAADIALGSHIETLRDAGSDGMKWEDWHPGWRFVKAVGAIETLISHHDHWPRNQDELPDYCEQIRTMCEWAADPNDFHMFHVFEKSPSRSDRLRQTLAAEARALRKERLSLWSIGPRQDLLDASFELFKPPVLMQYGRDTIRATRSDIDKDVLNDLWVDTQMNHIAWQLLGNATTLQPPHSIECFPWSKEGQDHTCASSNGTCRWFPSPHGTQLPESCPMLGTLRDLCGDYCDRLRPMCRAG